MKVNQIKFSGGYTCKHFKLKKQKVKRWCCGGSDEDYLPLCALNNQLCPGLVQCLLLGAVEKSELVKKWREDLDNNTDINGKDFIE